MYLYFSMTPTDLYKSIIKEPELLDVLSDEVLDKLLNTHINNVFLLHPDKQLTIYNKLTNNFKVSCLIKDIKYKKYFKKDFWKFGTYDWWRLFTNINIHQFIDLYENVSGWEKVENPKNILMQIFIKCDDRVNLLKSQELYYLIVKLQEYHFNSLNITKLMKYLKARNYTLRLSPKHWLMLVEHSRVYLQYIELKYFSSIQLNILRDVYNYNI